MSANRMTAVELATMLADHRSWCRGERGTRADLGGADLGGANLGGAYLGGAYLGGANLGRANLGRADLGGAVGIKWGQIGPVGQGRRLLSAWAHDSLPEPIIAGGCFMGTLAEFRDTIAGTPWDWHQGTDAEQERWRAECAAAADLLELAVTS